jgi:hypothetical protein
MLEKCRHVFFQDKSPRVYTIEGVWGPLVYIDSTFSPETPVLLTGPALWRGERFDINIGFAMR